MEQENLWSRYFGTVIVCKDYVYIKRTPFNRTYIADNEEELRRAMAQVDADIKLIERPLYDE